jgi:branched-subunit amino acid ABC-type transport system permease component
VIGGLAATWVRSSVSLVGVASMYAPSYGGSSRTRLSLALLIGVLMVRPQGLFGRTRARQV